MPNGNCIVMYFNGTYNRQNSYWILNPFNLISEKKLKYRYQKLLEKKSKIVTILAYHCQSGLTRNVNKVAHMPCIELKKNHPPTYPPCELRVE